MKFKVELNTLIFGRGLMVSKITVVKSTELHETVVTCSAIWPLVVLLEIPVIQVIIVIWVGNLSSVKLRGNKSFNLHACLSPMLRNKKKKKDERLNLCCSMFHNWSEKKNARKGNKAQILHTTKSKIVENYAT